jgi:hypothetical protein
MNRVAYAFFVLAAVAFVAGMLTLANREVSSGEAYPQYSSLRTDPDGTKLLYDGLGRLPGVSTARNFMALDSSSERHAVILLIGMTPERFDSADEYLSPLAGLAEDGNRVVVTFQYEPSLTALKMPEMEKRWDAKVMTDRVERRGHPFYFGESKQWTSVKLAGEKMLAMERKFGKGSIVLAAESPGFANDAVLAGREAELISRAIGEYQRVVFDEGHLGIAESGSVVALARRFRLTGLAAGLAICAALFLWKRIPVFPPPAALRTESRAGITSQAGLATLLRRHIAAGDLASTCWRAWLETNRHGVSQDRILRAETILRDPLGPVDTLRRIGAILQSKGSL